MFGSAAASTRRRFILALAAGTILLSGLTYHSDFSRPGAATRMAIYGAAAGLAQWVAVCAFARMIGQATISPRTAALVFWGVAVGWRVLVLLAEPGDDFWRYRWEGTVQLRHVNPYLVAPDSPSLAPLRDEDWKRVNHRDYSAIYPPAAELIFAVLAAIHLPPVGWKILFALADLGTAAMLLRLLRVRGNHPPRAGPLPAAAWYAWNPLVIYVFAGGGHYDSLMLLALVAAVWTLERAVSVRSVPAVMAGETFHGTAAPAVSSLTFAWVSSLWLGLAITLKLIPAVLLPVWFFALGWRRALLVLPFAAACLPVAAAIYGYPHAPVFASLRKFANVTRLNDAVWWLAEAGLNNNAEQQNKLYVPLILLGCGGLAIRFCDDWRRGLFWVLSVLLLLSPVLHPWYVVWILPFAVWRAETAARPHDTAPRAWLVLSASVFGYFVLWDLNRTGAPWVEPLWLRLSIYLPPCAFLLWEYLRNRLVLCPAGSRSNPST